MLISCWNPTSLLLVNNYLNKYISQPHLLTHLLSGNCTNHKKEIKQKFYKKYGNTRMQTLQFKLTLLKQDEKTTSVKLKKNYAWQVIYSKFSSNMKSVYHNFKGSSITVNETTTKNEVENFWKSIWESLIKMRSGWKN